MNITSLLNQMCHTDLSQTDIKAIGKSRGFKPQEYATPTMLASIYLTPIGIEKVMATLTTAEIAMLHLLHLAGKPVSVDWFERLYNPKFKPAWSNTYTQRYQPVFKDVRAQLVRKGILIMGQQPRLNGTKMEQWEFVFPEAFVPYLPLPFAETKQSTTSGEVRSDIARNKLLELLPQSKKVNTRLPDYELKIMNGYLFLGGSFFTAVGLQKWQQASWQAAMPVGSKMGELEKTEPKQYKTTPLEALNYLFGLLSADEWITPEQLDTALKIFCLRTFKTDEVCELGWKWGYLAKNEVDGGSYYRLAEAKAPDEALLTPDAYLSARDEETMRIDLHMIPYVVLEQLNKLAFLKCEDDGEITAVPDLIRMGLATADTIESPMMTWLQKNVPAFAKAQKTVQARQGKQIVHTNLHIARVKDFALRVQIEQKLKAHECITLDDEYIAFPPAVLSKVTRIIEQAGHVVKQDEGQR